MILRRLAVSTCLVFVSTLAAMSADRTIIVLDASGSMWGQIEGRSKIEIARDVLGKVTGEIDPAREVGLIAYGHRQKGQCSDIELVVEPRAGAASLINDAVGAIKPKGKTPLSDAVRQAAEALKYQEDKATVILVTDGLETCNADPCALGRELEAAGVDFTAHVVGFGLSDKEGREVACLADQTGGLYLAAADADELTEALDETVKAEAPAPAVEEVAKPEASLTASDEVEMAQPFDIGWDGPGGKFDRIEIFDPNALGGDGKRLRNKQIRNGDLDARTVRMPAPAVPGQYELRYYHAETRAVIATRPVTVTEAEVALLAPESIAIGKTLQIEWVGPGAKHDSVEIWDPAARGGDGKKLQDKRLRNDDFENQQVSMPAPGKPGTYELRYWNGQDRRVLATRQIEVTDAVVSMTPETPILAGKAFTTDWIGPGARYDQLEIWDPNARGGEGKKLFDKRLRNDDFENQRVTLPAPAKAGTYELRYWNGDNRLVLAAVPFEVEGIEVGLDAPAEIEAGRMLRVIWTGPGARYDQVEIWDPSAKGGEGKKLFDKRIRNDDYENQTVSLPAPAKAGTYELRYWNGDSKSVLATRDLQVLETVVSLSARDQVGQGHIIKIEWVGPGARFDQVEIWDPNARGGEGKKLFDQRLRNADFDNQKAVLPAPVKVGTYELRYWNGDSKTVMATRPIEVTPIEIGLTGPEAVETETKFSVSWQGPGARYDSVQIWDPAKNKLVSDKRVRNDDYDNNKVTLKAPKVAGEYVLRYWNGDNKAVLADSPLSVQ